MMREVEQLSKLIVGFTTTVGKQFCAQDLPEAHGKDIRPQIPVEKIKQPQLHE